MPERDLYDGSDIDSTNSDGTDRRVVSFDSSFGNISFDGGYSEEIMMNLEIPDYKIPEVSLEDLEKKKKEFPIGCLVDMTTFIPVYVGEEQSKKIGKIVAYTMAMGSLVVVVEYDNQRYSLFYKNVIKLSSKNCKDIYVR
ncbi:hypothetical protein LCGC14_2283870 [marine sediment metagenome]|uniref:Uncharacterized protein n=1 Tax=marine sediment metagenome TaxID=412755 RepID=A0A0F9CTQ5_9ZZZZ